MKCLRVVGFLVAFVLLCPMLRAASHREAPITAIDRSADITDFFAFVSYDNPDKVTLIMNVDPLLEPSNGPNYFPFDDDILYEIKVDNDNDAIADVVFQFRFNTEIRAPDVFTGFVGAGSGVSTPSNSPSPVAPGTKLIPPAITALDGPGSEGLSLRQHYSVTMLVRHGGTYAASELAHGSLFAVPSNVGPRTMPDYQKLYNAGIYSLSNGIRVFAGTVEDPFYIDLGAAFDSLNFRPSVTAPNPPGVLREDQDSDDTRNFTTDSLSGFNVNSIAIEVPISMLTRTGTKVKSTDPAATIGTWGTTSRPRVTLRRKLKDGVDPTGSIVKSTKRYVQIQRMGNPLINELLIGTGYKDKWSMSEPKDDAQFKDFMLDPLLARVFNALYGTAINVPPPPRTDLLPLVQYVPPIAAKGTAAGPIADLLRLNTGVAATPVNMRKRLGLLAGDAGGFPNGRRISDDVLDIAARVVAGVLAGSKFNVFPNNRIGDGVNVDDVQPYAQSFPYVSPAHSGRDRRHVDPGEKFPDGRNVPTN